MPQLTKKRSRKAGLPPGTLIHIGERKSERSRMTFAQYDEQAFSEKEVSAVEECCARPAGAVTWINVDGLHETALLERLGQGFGLHPLVLEDILNTDQRPKVEDYGDYLFVVLKRVSFREDNTFAAEQISIVLGRDFVLSFQEGERDDFAPVRARLRNGRGRARRVEADYLAYMLLDTVVDDYFITLERFDDQLEALEQQVLAAPQRATLARLHSLRRTLVLVMRAVWPLREVIGTLERGESACIHASTRIYLRDVYDHTLYAIDAVETLRELLTGMFEIYLSNINHRANEVIKMLTIIATVFLPLTFVTGWYGMNFRHMPELEWPWAYPAVLMLMFGAAVGMLFYFRRKKWL